MTTEFMAPPATMIDDRPADGLFRVNRAALVDEGVFARERAAIFDRCWLYVGHSSEVPQPGDFRARTVAGRPLVLWRGSDGVVRVFFNTCRHRGAQVCRVPEGNARGLTCFYHAWTYASDGRLTGLPDEQGYGPDFDRSRFGLASPALVDTYRGFVFCCFDSGAGSLRDYLGGAGEYLDLVADQSPDMEVVDGVHEYSMAANWKLFVENSLDGYHLMPLHRTYFDYLKSTEGSSLDPSKPTEARDLGNGHAVITVEGPWARPIARWTAALGEENRAYVDARRAELEQRFDAERARRIAITDRNLLIFPNLIVNDIMGIVIRTITPTSAGRTLMAQWTLATKGEPESVRARRLDSYVTFQGPGGLATPDDMEACESCQQGFATAAESPWSDISRGIHKEADGSPFMASDEIQQRAFWRHWRIQLERGQQDHGPEERHRHAGATNAATASVNASGSST
jgi:p-cumate 2,3-dioxygenase alpha subunit